MKKSVKLLIIVGILAGNVLYNKSIKKDEVKEKVQISAKKKEESSGTKTQVKIKSDEIKIITNDAKVTSEIKLESKEVENQKEEKIEAPVLNEEKTKESKEIEQNLGLEWENQENAEKEADEAELNEKVTLQNFEHTIKKGDTIYDLSREYKIKSAYIYANNLDQNLRVLQIGKKIKIPTEDGIFYTVKKGDSFSKLATKFDVNEKVIKDDNGIDTLLIGAKIFLREPKVSKYLKGTSSEYAVRPMVSGFANPLLAMHVTSGFGTRNHPVLKRVLKHGALDLRAKVGTKVMSAKDGVVTYAGRARGYGNVIIIKHANGYETRYAHLSRISVRRGQKITQNQIIGLSGATGRVTGPHLHFEIRKNGKTLNPLEYLKMS